MNKLLFNLFIALGGTFLTLLFGGWDISIFALVVIMGLDYLLGVTVAILQGAVDSRIGFKGLFKKSMIFIFLIIAILLDISLKTEWIFRTIVCYFFITNEVLSVFKNIAKIHTRQIKE